MTCFPTTGMLFQGEHIWPSSSRLFVGAIQTSKTQSDVLVPFFMRMIKKHFVLSRSAQKEDFLLARHYYARIISCKKKAIHIEVSMVGGSENLA